MKFAKLMVVMAALIASSGFAKPLTVGNGTSANLSAGTASGVCSNLLSNIVSHSSATADDQDLSQLCQSSPHACRISLFSGAGCYGAPLATVLIDIDKGVDQPVFCAPHYTLTVSYPFNSISLSEAL